MPEALALLTEINLDDLVRAFGCQDRRRLNSLVRGLFRGPARRFAQQMLRFDELIVERGLAQAACTTEQHYARSVWAYGRRRVPEGSVLFLANHPGVTDTLAIIAALDRDDLLVIALDRPFLLSLPNLSHHLAFVTEDPADRAALVRKIARHLRGGGAVLTFPAGRNELDPDLTSRAVDSLAEWTDSDETFARLAPQAVIMTVNVRGVYWSATARSPFVRLRRSLDDQQLLGSALQLLATVVLGMRPVTIRVEFGAPLRLDKREASVAAGLHASVLGEMRRLISNSPIGEGIQVL